MSGKELSEKLLQLKELQTQLSEKKSKYEGILESALKSRDEIIKELKEKNIDPNKLDELISKKELELQEEFQTVEKTLHDLKIKFDRIEKELQ